MKLAMFRRNKLFKISNNLCTTTKDTYSTQQRYNNVIKIYILVLIYKWTAVSFVIFVNLFFLSK